MASASTISTIALVLTDAEAFLSGKPVSVQIPEETITVEGIKVTTAATTVTFSK